jgi:AcrR family transcriptional regulator
MDNIKSLILDKAQERFNRFGYKKTTMDELSRDCKISKKTIYAHFRDKEDLFRSLMVREDNEVRKMIFDSIAGISNPLDKLIQLVKTAMDFFNADNFLTRLLKADELLYSVYTSEKYNALIIEDIVSIIADIIREGKKEGEFRDVDEKVIAYAGFRLFEAFSYMRTMEFSEEKIKQGYYTDVLIDFFVNALVKK